MTAHSIGVRPLLAALVVTLCPATLHAQPASANPWTRVPAAPTSCYSGQDQYYEKASELYYAIEQDIYRQEEINQQVKERSQSIDPFEKMALMQQMMMDDPQKYAEMLRGNNESGQEIYDQTMANSAAKTAMKNELNTLHGRYKSATDKALAPAEAKFDALVKKVEAGGGSFSDGEGFDVPEWAMAEWRAILEEKNLAYTGTVCPQWFGPTGQYTAWLKRYKDHLVQKEIPLAEQGEALAASQYEMFGTPTASYKSTAKLVAVKDYVLHAHRDIFQKRWTAPQKL